MADKTQINLERIRACDAEWDESKHSRANNGQFTSGGGGGVAAASGNKEKISALRKEQDQQRFGDNKVVIGMLINHVQEDGMSWEDSFKKVDAVVKAGNVGGSEYDQERLREWWRGFRKKHGPK